VKGITVVLLVLLLKNSVTDKDFTFFFILLLLSILLDSNSFPSTGATIIEANNTNCSEIADIVIVFILNFVLIPFPTNI
jgi:hypothetical protein